MKTCTSLKFFTRLTSFSIAAMSVACAVGGVVSVSDVAFMQTDQRDVVVTYMLTGDEAAIVTLDVLTNGVSIGGQNITRLSGDVNRVVEPSDTSQRRIYWRATEDWPEHKIASGVTVEVNAWSLSDPPDYFVMDLETGERNYYLGADTIPGGVTNDLYKTTKLVMRRIPAGGKTFLFGYPATEISYSYYLDRGIAMPQHSVSLTDDFYMGIYEITQAQFAQIWPSQSSGQTGKVPMTAVNFANLRGSNYYWPLHGHTVQTNPARFMSCVRSISGNTIEFDLPTEAQWEFACRAGSTTLWYDNQTWDTRGNCPNYMWADSWATEVHEVGLLKPNAYGLYDMHGNASEICLDGWSGGSAASDGSAETDPEGPATDGPYAYRVVKGGAYDNSKFECGSCLRGAKGGGAGTADIPSMGFRLVCPLPASGASTVAAARSKKIIYYGWDVGEASLETVLANADKFADAGFDGVALRIKGNRAGQARLSQTGDFALTDPKWTKAEFATQVALLREITAKPGLRHCYLEVGWSPTQRLAWDDDEAWERAAHNMGIIAWLAKAGRVDGLFIDPEDYNATGQFHPCPEEGDYATISRLARRRGAQIVSAMAAENPDLHIVFYWLLSWTTRWLGAPETDLAAIAAQREDPWPPFVNGMLDALPPEMRLADGNEFGYLFSAEKEDYVKDSARQRHILSALVAPENLRTFHANVQVSSGHYLDCYVNGDSSHWYKPPLNGSRLARLEDDLHQGFAIADEAVWVYGEQRQVVTWTGNAARWNGVNTWDQELSGFADVLRRTGDPHGWAAETLARKRSAGTLSNLAPTSSFYWSGEAVSGSVEAGGSVASVTGAVNGGTFVKDLTGVQAGQWYFIEFDVQGTMADRSGISWKLGAVYDNDTPQRFPVFETPVDGWRHGTILVRIPHNVDTLRLLLGPKHTTANETTSFRNVALYRLDN